MQRCKLECIAVCESDKLAVNSDKEKRLFKVAGNVLSNFSGVIVINPQQLFVSLMVIISDE